MSEEVISSRILRNGEKLTIKVSTPPLSREATKIFLATPELSKTRNESRMRLYGALRNHSSDYFFYGEIGNTTVGTVWYCTPITCPEIAYMGETFTNKKNRNKGVATALLEDAIDYFRKIGGKVVYVTNLCPNAPHRIYRKLGFEAYGYGYQTYQGIIRLIVNGRSGDFDRDYYQHDPNTSIRTANWGDLPHFIALLNYPHSWIVRAYNFGLIGGGVFDELGISFMNFMKTLKQGNIGLALENKKHRMVGTAYTSSLHSISQVHVKTLDFLVHPSYLKESVHLLQSLIEKLQNTRIEKIQAYAASTDKSRIGILNLCGFEKEATMGNQLRVGSKKIDLEVFSANISNRNNQETSQLPLPF